MPPLQQEQLHKHYQNADQVIVISYNIYGFEQLGTRPLRPGVPVKSILEHEVWNEKPCWKWKDKTPFYSACLGLRKGALGIKIADTKKSSPEDFFQTLQQYDRELAAKYLEKTHCKDFKEFKERNFFTCAYSACTHRSGLSGFLALLSISHFESEKDIVVHLSSLDSNFLFNYVKEGYESEDFDPQGLKIFKTFLSFDSISKVKQIEFYSDCDACDFAPLVEKSQDGSSAEKQVYIYPVNSSGKRIIRIFSSFLSEQSFNEIFDAVDMAYVSGDNTFEKSVAQQCFPFYHSTNFVSKMHTLASIIDIVDKLDFTEPQKVALKTYFSYPCLGYAPQRARTFFGAVAGISLEEISTLWPKIAIYLKEERNFYKIYEQFITYKPEVAVELPKPTFFSQPEEKIQSETDDKASLKLK